MKTDMLETLSDDELRAVRQRANELLQAHDEERKAKAIADARALKAKALNDARVLLASVGLSLKAVDGKSGRRAVPYKGGHLYRHPAKPELVWNAKGQKPNWLRELEREGGKPVEVTGAANDNAAPATKKTG